MHKDLALVPTQKIDRFLLALANWADSRSVKIFLERFGDMLTDLPSARQWTRIFSTPPTRPYSFETTLQLLRETVTEQDEPVDEILELRKIRDLSNLVKGIWRAEGREERLARILALHRVLANSYDPAFLLTKEVLWGQGSPRGPFQQAILRLLKEADRALICPNPECPARFFFRIRRRQRYCSEVCAGFGQRLAKQRWWAKEGNDWRRERKQRSTAGKKKGKKHGTRKAR